MKKVSFIKTSGDFNFDNESTIASFIPATEWYEISDDDYKFLLQYWHLKYTLHNRMHLKNIMLVEEVMETPAEIISDLKKEFKLKIEAKEKEEIARKKAKEKATEIRKERLLKKKEREIENLMLSAGIDRETAEKIVDAEIKRKMKK